MPKSPATASLKELAAALASFGLHAAVREPFDGPPYLEVRNPTVSEMNEQIRLHDGAFCYSWGEPITSGGQPAAAAAILAYVLRATEAPQ